MRRLFIFLLLAFAATACAPAAKYKGPEASGKTSALAAFDDGQGSDLTEINDPIEGFNRAIFAFNDGLYVYVLRPVASGYAAVVPEDGRIGVRNFFSNIAFPIRYVNNLLQFKFTDAQKELARFIINTGSSLGFYDTAGKHLDLAMADEDFGQTLGSYGLDNGFYIVLPVLGPSTARDVVGRVGDWFADPLNYIEFDPSWVEYAGRGVQVVNDTSLRIEDIDMIRNQPEPYAAMRSGYVERRWKQVQK